LRRATSSEVALLPFVHVFDAVYRACRDDYGDLFAPRPVDVGSHARSNVIVAVRTNNTSNKEFPWSRSCSSPPSLPRVSAWPSSWSPAADPELLQLPGALEVPGSCHLVPWDASSSGVTETAGSMGSSFGTSTSASDRRAPGMARMPATMRKSSTPARTSSDSTEN